MRGNGFRASNVHDKGGLGAGDGAGLWPLEFVLGCRPGALPQSGMEMRRWRVRMWGGMEIVAGDVPGWYGDAPLVGRNVGLVRPIVAGDWYAWGASVPGIAFVAFDSVFREEGAVFFLKGVRAVMFFLVVDVVEQSIQVRWTDGEGPVAALPCKGGQCRRLGFQPFGGRGFQFLDELGHGDRS